MARDSRRILIVDDDADTLANLRDILSDVGFEISTASSGSKALDKIKFECPNGKLCFDLCLLDFKMPEMDGVELFQRIRQIDTDAKAIMITAYAGDDGIERAHQAGTYSILRKPIEIRELLTEIDGAFRQ
jgi:CheY-like chemotaxis protein